MARKDTGLAGGKEKRKGMLRGESFWGERLEKAEQNLCKEVGKNQRLKPMEVKSSRPNASQSKKGGSRWIIALRWSRKKRGRWVRKGGINPPVRRLAL